MRKILVAATVAVFAVLASPAYADEEPRRTVERFTLEQHGSLEDLDACGTYGVRWNINLFAEGRRVRDEAGRLLKVVLHVREDNTVQRLEGGAPTLTLRDGPVHFTQKTLYDPPGTRDRIVITGLSVNVRRGDEKLVDRGRIVIDAQTGVILESAGKHPLRELLNGSFDISLALPGFCHILRPDGPPA